jgi:hypothetical protein
MPGNCHETITTVTITIAFARASAQRTVQGFRQVVCRRVQVHRRGAAIEPEKGAWTEGARVAGCDPTY